MTLEKDTLLRSRYRVLEILGEGGMGAVYKAQDESLGVTVAVKENLFTTEEYSRQFRVEATLLATLRHPNLTRVTDHFVHDEIQYIVMDYIEGEDMRDRMERLGILDEDEVILIGVGLCDALTYLHNLKPTILHRDVKPGNVRISPEGRVFLVDFGLAKIVQGNQMTVTGARAMTPGYSPPEQYGTARTDERSDVYSLGATLYSALTGKLPEDGLARAMKQTELTPVRLHNPRVPRKLASVIEKSLAIQPEDRYQSAEEFRTALVKARGITRRRISPQDLVVAPPPPDSSGRSSGKRRSGERRSGERRSGERPSSGSASGRSPEAVEGLFFVQDQGAGASTGRRTRSRGIMVWLLFLLLLAAGAGSIYFNPDLSARALAFFNTPTVMPSPTPTATEPQPATTATLAAVAALSATPTATEVPPTPVSTATSTREPTFTPSPTPTPQPTDTPTITPTPIGGAGQIAFVSDRTGKPQIWLMDVNGESLEQLTDIRDGACQPDWSPDGQQLVFISPCPRELEEYPDASMYILTLITRQVEPVPGSAAGDYDPDWSPDGSQILFTGRRNGGNAQVYLLDLETGTTQMLHGESYKNFHPAWNADGSRVAFISGNLQVWLMEADGTDADRFSRSSSRINSFPAWSPDGQNLIFTQREVFDMPPSLRRVSLKNDGFDEVQVLGIEGPARNGSYSPDGRWLVYEGWPDGKNHDIFRLDLSTLTPIRLTLDYSYEFDPAWRP